MIKNPAKFILIALALSAFGCQRLPFQSQSNSPAPATLRDIPALKLNYRFEPDVPPPAADADQQTTAEEKNAAVQNDFDTSRPQEVLEKTFTSPDKQRVVAVYKKAEDLYSDYRLDMYAPDGKILHKLTPNGLAARFPETVVWSPDSNNVAFVGVTRTVGQANTAPTPTPADTNEAQPNANLEVDTNSNAAANAAPLTAAPENASPGVLTFRTEQIYLGNKDGSELKPLTQNEGLIYFYFVWAPDSSALAGLAASWREWQFGQIQAEQRGEIFIPSGRPRVVEKNGRERRLDDNVTMVQPVWSPDSSKVAAGFDKEVRIYDAIGDTPTQAAILLRNQLLISSKIYDEQKQKETESAGNSNANANGASNANVNANAKPNANGINANTNSAEQANTALVSTDTSTLPDENTLVSFNPIVELKWTENSMLYLRTTYVKEMRNPADSVHSFLRWHRLIFSPQAGALN